MALADSGAVDCLAFDCLAERTLALAQMRRMDNPAAGQDLRVARIAREFAPFLKRGKQIIGNFGAANPGAAVSEMVDALRHAGYRGCRVGAIMGDDVLEQVRRENVELPELNCRVADLGAKVVSAHAYIGAEPIVELLQQDANIILGGRLADPSLFVGPICHAMGWALDDWDRLGTATVVGHLLECGSYSTGANHADPPYRMVPDIHNLALPMATVNDREIIVTKLPGTGGAVNAVTVKSQLCYEIHDPRRYMTPDVTANFADVVVEDLGNDRVRISGASGSARPETYKVLVGVDYGYKSVAEGSFGGPGCVGRARLAEAMIRRLVEPFGKDVVELRVDFHGMTALFGEQIPATTEPVEVRLRVSARCTTAAVADAVGYEVETAVLFGPSGGGGLERRVSRLIGVTPARLPRASVPLHTEAGVS